MRLDEVASAVGGRLADGADPAARVTGAVEIDSRLVGPGGLFAALRGERHDGHAFAAASVDAGAVAVLAERPVGVPAVVVADVQVALGRLARAVLDRCPGTTVVSLTGSAGKTSTKDLLAALLGEMGPTVAPPGSFNNELGHPYTVLRIDDATRYLVLECGARGLGHVAELCRIAPPRLGVVLNVGTAHVGEFGSPDAIALAKGELIEAVVPEAEGGVALLNEDDPRVRAMAARTAGRVVTFGLSGTADVRADGLALDTAGRPGFSLRAREESHPVQLQIHGEHMVSNALAAAAVAIEAGMAPAHVASVLSHTTLASRWRMEVRQRSDGLVVINDAYNANPESMRAALKSLVTIAGARRSWAVLGQMAELGEQSLLAHDEIGRLAVRLDVSRLVVVGPDAAAIHYGASLEGSWNRESVLVPDVDAAYALLEAEVGPDDVVLVKGSRVVGLERVAERLLSAPPVAAPVRTPEDPAAGARAKILQQEAYLAEGDE